MCTWITEKVAASGAARGVSDWMDVSQINVFYDHPVEVGLDHAVIIDFVDPAAGVGARVGVELSAASAVGLMKAIEEALRSPEAQHDLARERASSAGDGEPAPSTPHDLAPAGLPGLASAVP